MAILRIANIEKSYNITKTQRQDVLKGITLDFDNGEVVALVGESGCGKSTLINIIGGLDTEYTGSVICKGEFLRDFTEEQMDDYRKKRVGLVFQNYNLIGHMNVLQNIEIAMSMSDLDIKLRKDRAIDLLRLVGLEAYKDKMPSQLSGGQKQRIAIARALANNPSIILADEPTGALDKDSSKIVMEIFKKIGEMGKLVLIVTHSELVANECSRIILLDDGKVVSDETKYKVKINDKRIDKTKPKSIKTLDLFKLAYKNLLQTLSRSILVSIGMGIGILAFVLILCLSSGLTNYVNDVYSDSIVSKELTVTKNSSYSFTDSQLEDIDEISGISNVYESYILKSVSYSITINEEEKTGSLSSISAFYTNFYPEIIYGVLPNSDGYIIINTTLATKLSSNNIIACLGETLTIIKSGDEHDYIISGIYQDTSENSTGLNCLVSSSDLKSDLSLTSVNILYITVKNTSYVNTIIDDLEALGFNVYQADSSVQTVISYIEMGTTVLTAVSGISLIVAAIMIFIVLYISIVERTKEIGILRAIGARKKDIRRMFIFEALLLGFAGGLFGVLGTILISGITNIICYFTLESTLISFNVLYYILGILLSSLIALLAGLSPSIKASSLDPVESLRYE